MSYLLLADAASYCGRNGNAASRARWSRRHLLPHLPVYQLPGSTPMLRKEDIDTFLSRHRVDPVDVGAVVAAVLLKRSPVRGERGRYQGAA